MIVHSSSNCYKGFKFSACGEAFGVVNLSVPNFSTKTTWEERVFLKSTWFPSSSYWPQIHFKKHFILHISHWVEGQFSNQDVLFCGSWCWWALTFQAMNTVLISYHHFFYSSLKLVRIFKALGNLFYMLSYNFVLKYSFQFCFLAIHSSAAAVLFNWA